MRNHCSSRDLLSQIVIIVSLIIYHLIFLQDILLIVCVFFFSLLTTKVHNYPLFIYYLLGSGKYIRPKALRSGKNATGQKLQGLVQSPDPNLLSWNGDQTQGSWPQYGRQTQGTWSQVILSFHQTFLWLFVFFFFLLSLLTIKVHNYPLFVCYLLGSGNGCHNQAPWVW